MNNHETDYDSVLRQNIESGDKGITEVKAVQNAANALGYHWA